MSGRGLGQRSSCFCAACATHRSTGTCTSTCLGAALPLSRGSVSPSLNAFLPACFCALLCRYGVAFKWEKGEDGQDEGTGAADCAAAAQKHLAAVTAGAPEVMYRC